MKYYVSHNLPGCMFSLTKLFFCKTGLLRNFYAHDAFDDLKNDVDEK